MQAEQPIKTFEVSTSPHQKHYRGFVLLFFAALFLLTSGGRINSGDAGTQLQAAMLLANTGHLGTSLPPGVNGNSDTGLWVKSLGGLYYQCHDIGNICLMFPAAWLSSRLSHASPDQKILNPPILARLGVAWTYALFSALGTYFVFRLFALVYSVRIAFLLSLLFSTGTIFWAYTKSAWDVTGASIGVAMLCYFAYKLLLYAAQPAPLEARSAG